MGCPDTVEVPCPECGAISYFQSKGGLSCSLNYVLKDAPSDVMSNVNRHSPYKCDCGVWFAVDEVKRIAIRTGPKASPIRINGYYDNLGT